MQKTESEREEPIHPSMTLLEVVSRYRGSEEVFRRFDEKAGVCLCCKALFDSLETIAVTYHLDLEELLQTLKKWISEKTLWEPDRSA
jgi:hypothetical protein